MQLFGNDHWRIGVIMIQNSKRLKFFGLPFCLLLLGCGASIKRTGYTKSEIHARKCNVCFALSEDNSISNLKKLGSIKVSDNGFSMQCDEYFVKQIITDDACSMNANIVLITEQKFPNFASTCYRVSADFYTIDSTEFKSMKCASNEF